MTLSLTVTDVTDGSGVATISGSSGLNTLYRAPWTGISGFDNDWTRGQLSWTSVGTRTGNGTIAVSGAGFWLWQVVNGSSFASTYQPLSDVSALPIEERILNAVQVRIQGLALDGIDSDAIIPRWIPRRTPGVDPLPCVAVAVWGAETYTGTMTQSEDYGYPVAIALLDARNGNDRANFSRNLKWRETVIRAFRSQRLAGVPEVMDCRPESAQICDVTRFTGSEEIVMLIVLRFIARQTRL